jgi:hypothetical protein
VVIPAWFMIAAIIEIVALIVMTSVLFKKVQMANWYNERLVADIENVKRQYVVLVTIIAFLGVSSAILFGAGRLDLDFIRLGAFLFPIKYFTIDLFFFKIADMGLE